MSSIEQIIPNDWNIQSLGDVCIKVQDGNYGAFYPKSSEFIDYGVPFLTSKVLGKTGKIDKNKIDFISEEKHQQLKKAHLKLHDVLFTNRGASVGAIGFVDESIANGNIGPQLTLLRTGEDIKPTYLYHIMKSFWVQNQIQGQDSGSAMNFFGIGTTLKFRFPTPNLKEQTAIANALSDVDALLTELEKLIAKKQAIKTAIMQQLLTGKTRLPQFATYTEGEKQGQPKGTKPSELGEIPEDWDVRPIESVIKDLRGGAPFKPSDFTNAGVKVLPKGGVVRGGVLRVHEKDQQFCSKNWSLKYSKNCVDNRYTIVVLRDLVPSGPSIGLMVNIPTDEKYVLAQGVYGFIAEDEETSNYLIQYSNTTQYRKAANEIMVGSTQVHITNGAFKALTVPLPPKEEQGAIATILSDMDNEIQTLEQRLAKTRQIKQGMMQELLTGRTRLPY